MSHNHGTGRVNYGEDFVRTCFNNRIATLRATPAAPPTPTTKLEEAGDFLIARRLAAGDNVPFPSQNTPTPTRTRTRTRTRTPSKPTGPVSSVASVAAERSVPSSAAASSSYTTAPKTANVITPFTAPTAAIPTPTLRQSAVGSPAGTGFNPDTPSRRGDTPRRRCGRQTFDSAGEAEAQSFGQMYGR